MLFLALISGSESFKPFRVPATPLWVSNPYVNWLLPANNATDAWVRHVRNDKVGSMTAALRIDDNAPETFSILGPLGQQCSGALRMPPMLQLGPALVLPTRTVYRFTDPKRRPHTHTCEHPHAHTVSLTLSRTRSSPRINVNLTFAQPFSIPDGTMSSQRAVGLGHSFPRPRPPGSQRHTPAAESFTGLQAGRGIAVSSCPPPTPPFWANARLATLLLPLQEEGSVPPSSGVK